MLLLVHIDGLDSLFCWLVLFLHNVVQIYGSDIQMIGLRFVKLLSESSSSLERASDKKFCIRFIYFKLREVQHRPEFMIKMLIVGIYKRKWGCLSWGRCLSWRWPWHISKWRIIVYGSCIRSLCCYDSILLSFSSLYIQPWANMLPLRIFRAGGFVFLLQLISVCRLKNPCSLLAAPSCLVMSHVTSFSSVHSPQKKFKIARVPFRWTFSIWYNTRYT